MKIEYITPEIDVVTLKEDVITSSEWDLPEINW